MNKHFDKPEFYVQKAADVLIYNALIYKKKPQNTTTTQQKQKKTQKIQQLLEQKE